MRGHRVLFLILLLTVGLLFTGCSQQASAPTTGDSAVEEPVVEAPTAEPTAAPTEEPAPEPTEAPPPVVEEIVEISDAELSAATDAFLGAMVKYNTTGLDDLNLALAENPPFLLDVRQPEELEEKGHIAGAVLVPLRELGQHLDLLPSFETPIVIYCGSGHRSTIAMGILGSYGYNNIRSLKGGFGGWVEAGYPVVEYAVP